MTPRGEQCLGHRPGRESQGSVLSTSNEMPLNKPVTWKESPSRSEKKIMCACLGRGERDTHTYMAYSFRGN